MLMLLWSVCWSTRCMCVLRQRHLLIYSGAFVPCMITKKVHLSDRTHPEVVLSLLGHSSRPLPWEQNRVNTHTDQDVRSRQTDGQAEGDGGRKLVGSWSFLIGRLWSSQLGVVLQDDLQLLTQHDVASNLQLAGEERLTKQRKHTWVILLYFLKESTSPLISGWVDVGLFFSSTWGVNGGKMPAASASYK